MRMFIRNFLLLITLTTTLNLSALAQVQLPTSLENLKSNGASLQLSHLKLSNFSIESSLKVADLSKIEVLNSSKEDMPGFTLTFPEELFKASKKEHKIKLILSFNITSETFGITSAGTNISGEIDGDAGMLSNLTINNTTYPKVKSPPTIIKAYHSQEHEDNVFDSSVILGDVRNAQVDISVEAYAYSDKSSATTERVEFRFETVTRKEHQTDSTTENKEKLSR